MECVYKNPEIVKHLLPDIKSQVVHVGIVQKQTDAGEMTRFSASSCCWQRSRMVWNRYGQGFSNENCD